MKTPQYVFGLLASAVYLTFTLTRVYDEHQAGLNRVMLPKAAWDMRDLCVVHQKDRNGIPAMYIFGEGGLVSVDPSVKENCSFAPTTH
jgi:hypothetical protein